MSAAGWDVVVVGAGASGATLAARLSEDPGRRVLLLEAGADPGGADEVPAELVGRATSDSGIAHAWKFKAEAVPGREIEYPAGKVLGGGSAINSAVALRGAPADYDEWAAAGNPGWSWPEVLPYFRRLESDRDFGGEHHGADGPVPIRRAHREDFLGVHRALFEAALALGHAEAPDLNLPGAVGVGPWPMNVEDGQRVSTAAAYLTSEVRRRSNLKIRVAAPVRRLAFAGTRATGIELEDGELVAAGEVILCAGAICTPGILLRSGIGATARVRAAGGAPLVDLPGVGENLIDHAFAWIGLVPTPGVCDLDSRSVQVGLRYTARGSGEAGDMQLLAVLPVDLADAPELAAKVGAERIFMLGAGLQRPRSRGRVSWPGGSSSDPPRIELRLNEAAADVERLGEGVRLAWEVAHSPQMAPYVERVAMLDEGTLGDDRALAAYVEGVATTFKHPCGTARMGTADDAGAVVDAGGRVYGVEGLRVADMSIAPTIPRANTNLTAIMIGEVLAARMRAEGLAVSR